MTYEEFQKYLPTRDDHRGLSGEWTRSFYEHFHRCWPYCSIFFTYNRLKLRNSRATKSSFWVGKARCKIPSCVSATFSIRCEPERGSTVDVCLIVDGQCNHVGATRENEESCGRHKRFLTGSDRLAVGVAVNEAGQTPASIYYEHLSQMNAAEIRAGNTTECQTPQILRQSAMEYRLVVVVRFHSDNR